MTTETQLYYQYQQARFAEGWELFESSYGREIEALDERQIDGAPELLSDLEAVAVVLRGCLAGNAHAHHALSFIDYRSGVFDNISDALSAVERCLADPCKGMCQHSERQDDWAKLHHSRLYLNHRDGTEHE
jgi:hypothetical protein